MAHPIAPDYGQQFLFAPALEDWLATDHPARFRREFVAQLDLPALQFATPTASEGRPPFAPSLLLKIWLYGYFQCIRSTRKLEAAGSEHLALLCLTGLLAPDHNTLWRFWRDNKKALPVIFKQTVRMCATLNLRILHRRWRTNRSGGPGRPAPARRAVPAGQLAVALVVWWPRLRPVAEPVRRFFDFCRLRPALPFT